MTAAVQRIPACMLVWHGTSIRRFRLMQESGFRSDRHQLFVGDTVECADYYAAQKARGDGCDPVVLELDFGELCRLAEPAVIRRSGGGPPVFDPSYRPKGLLNPDFHYGGERQRGQWVFVGEWISALRGAWLREPYVAFTETLWEPPSIAVSPIFP